MKIFLLKRIREADHEEIQSLVVIAEDEEKARGLACSDTVGPENRSVWDSPQYAICRLLGTAEPGSEPEIVCENVVSA